MPVPPSSSSDLLKPLNPEGIVISCDQHKRAPWHRNGEISRLLPTSLHTDFRPLFLSGRWLVHRNAFWHTTPVQYLSKSWGERPQYTLKLPTSPRPTNLREGIGILSRQRVQFRLDVRSSLTPAPGGAGRIARSPVQQTGTTESRRRNPCRNHTGAVFTGQAPLGFGTDADHES